MRRWAMVAGVMVMALPLWTSGQEANVFSNALAVVRRNNDPLERFVMDNGLIGLVKADRSAPTVSIQIWVGTGSIHEGRYQGAGITHAFEHMIFKGTKTRKPTDITREINEAGGAINAYTSFDRTVFYADLPAVNWRVGFDVLSDAVMNATYPADEWQKERDVILREIAMGDDDPGRVLSKLLWHTAYRVHPLRHPVIGYRELVRQVERQDLLDFWNQRYVPNHMIVSVVGDIDAAEVRAAIQETFTPFARRFSEPVLLPKEPRQIAPRTVRKRGEYTLSRLEWAYHTVALNHPDAVALDVLAQVVGQGRSSRLVQRIKEDQQLAHRVSAWSYTPKDPGLFGISATFAPEKEMELRVALQDEIDTWKSERFDDVAVQKARRMILVSELSGLQTMKGQATGFASGEYYSGSPRFPEIYLELLNQVTPQSLQRVARRYLRDDNRTLALLTPTSTGPSEPREPVQTEATVALPSTSTLANGLTVVVRPDHRLPLVHFCLAAKGGPLFAPTNRIGITRLISDLLIRGTTTHGKEEIADTVDSLGATLSPFSGFNSFGLRAKCLADDQEVIAAMLADCLFESTFPEDELALQRQLQLASIQARKEQPFALARDALDALLYPGHPYRYDPLGTADTVTAITREDLIDFAHRLRAPSRMALAIFGDITLPEAVKLAQTYFLRPAAEPPSPLTPHGPFPSPDLPARVVQYEPRQQAIVLSGAIGIRVDDPRRDALDVLETALSGLSSDLAITVREERALAYYVGAYLRPGLAAGPFVLYAGTEAQHAGEVETLIQDEVRRVTTEGLREEEFTRARDQLIASAERQLQDIGQAAMLTSLNVIYGLGPDYFFKTRQRLMALEVEDVRSAAKSILDPDRLATVLLLPGSADDGNTPGAP